jgi:hypothetical protein
MKTDLLITKLTTFAFMIVALIVPSIEAIVVAILSVIFLLAKEIISFKTTEANRLPNEDFTALTAEINELSAKVELQDEAINRLKIATKAKEIF